MLGERRRNIHTVFSAGGARLKLDLIAEDVHALGARAVDRDRQWLRWIRLVDGRLDALAGTAAFLRRAHQFDCL